MIASIAHTVTKQHRVYTHKMHDQLAFLFAFYNCVIIINELNRKKIVYSSVCISVHTACE